MTSRIVAGIAFRLFAIWLLVKTILAIPLIWASYLSFRQFRSPEEVSILWPLIIFISLFAVSSLMILVIWRLGTRAIDELPGPDMHSQESGIEALLVQLLGLYLTVTSLAEMPYHVRQYVTSLGDQRIGHGLWVLCELFKMIIGLLLLAKARAWLLLLRTLRGFGLRPYNNSLNSDG